MNVLQYQTVLIVATVCIIEMYAMFAHLSFIHLIYYSFIHGFKAPATGDNRKAEVGRGRFELTVVTVLSTQYSLWSRSANYSPSQTPLHILHLSVIYVLHLRPYIY